MSDPSLSFLISTMKVKSTSLRVKCDNAECLAHSQACSSSSFYIPTGPTLHPSGVTVGRAGPGHQMW